MDEKEFLSKERYPYEIARYLGVSRYRMTKLLKIARFYDATIANYRKLPRPIVRKIIDLYNSL